MAKKSLEEVYEPDWSDNIEPYTSAIALGADAIGLGTSFASGGVLAPIGAAIAGIGNVPNIIVDGYQSIRDWKRTIKDGTSPKQAFWNTGETILDLLGAKLALKGVKYVNDREFAKEVKGLIQDETKRREGKRYILRKRGMSDEEITKYITLKATNTVMNSKNINTKKKETEKRTSIIGRRAGFLIGAPSNIYHASPIVNPKDNTRVSNKILKF